MPWGTGGTQIPRPLLQTWKDWVRALLPTHTSPLPSDSDMGGGVLHAANPGSVSQGDKVAPSRDSPGPSATARLCSPQERCLPASAARGSRRPAHSAGRARQGSGPLPHSEFQGPRQAERAQSGSPRQGGELGHHCEGGLGECQAQRGSEFPAPRDPWGTMDTC